MRQGIRIAYLEKRDLKVGNRNDNKHIKDMKLSDFWGIITKTDDYDIIMYTNEDNETIIFKNKYAKSGIML